jgi:protein-S-isoprenylcysteine O-methyltransferase Ste14
MNFELKWILFLIALILEILYGLLFVLTVKVPGFRFWPPPSWRSWQFFVSWFLLLVVANAFLFLGLFDLDSFWLPHFGVRLPVALALFVLASILGIWIYTIFPIHATLGMKGRLVTRGPYSYSRNPQYISDSLSILGYMVLTNSWMVWVLGILGVILNIMAPFTEEPWLEERFGDEYRAYKSAVPRFIRFGKKGR